MVDAARDWLVLSIKWSGEELVWYRSNRKGYTVDLAQAGRYTQAEAIQCQEENVTLAVPLEVALTFAVTKQVIYRDNLRSLAEQVAARGLSVVSPGSSGGSSDANSTSSTGGCVGGIGKSDDVSTAHVPGSCTTPSP